ncbi:uncharacterized protein LOC110975984 [Acanthaster planci]|uniref:Uncharacterized protein LOC110975984 n=1 Tax=Acanthaster planci TaxID=133434 RepID=A0A8B7XUP2_ACAPL|nr:uncharacterized protein LOC110975984 [Acanthaster planci]
MAAKSTLYVTLLLSCVVPFGQSLLFGAFNIQVLGKTKMGKPEVVDYLTEILARYDVVLIQELRDASGEAIVDLLNALNDYSPHTYEMIISSRMGRSSSKEQYVFFYKPSEVSVVDTYEYPEPNDEFERQPLIARFKKVCPCPGLSEFAVVGIHVKPDDAVAEVDHLSEVYDHVVNTWGLQDVILTGDFNADCNYISSSKWSRIRLRTQSRFEWLISDYADTTVSNTNCAYDRIVVAGSGMKTYSRAAATYYFDAVFGLDQTTVIFRNLTLRGVYSTSILVTRNKNRKGEQDVFIHSPQSCRSDGGDNQLHSNQWIDRKRPAYTMRFHAVFGLCFLAVILVGSGAAVEVASFNIKKLGDSKMNKPHVVAILHQILSRYDLVMIQELTASTPDAITTLLNGLNVYSGKHYQMIVGPREGRTKAKEEYVFFYRADLFLVKDHYAYVEKKDEFERQPYIVRFNSLTPTSLPSDFAVVNIHTKPGYKYTRYEIDALVDVYDDVVDKWDLQDVIITGDYNADCSYVRPSYWPTIRLRTQSRFRWLTPDDADTTVASNDCAFDRFVLVGSKMTAANPSFRVFKFDSEYGLDNSFANEVSDHYPIELTF